MATNPLALALAPGGGEETLAMRTMVLPGVATGVGVAVAVGAMGDRVVSAGPGENLQLPKHLQEVEVSFSIPIALKRHGLSFSLPKPSLCLLPLD